MMWKVIQPLRKCMLFGMAIFISMSLWGCLDGGDSTMAIDVAATATALQSAKNAYNGWNFAAVAITDDGGDGTVQVENYSYLDRKKVLLFPKKLHDPQFDGVSVDGQDVLYHSSSNNHTMYYRGMAPLAQTDFFYKLDAANAGNAIWMPDSLNALILARGKGVLQVNTQSGQGQNVVSFPLNSGGHAVDVARLTFFRDNYLYFVGGAGLCQDKLCRVNLHDTQVQQVTADRSMGASYLLSPDGTTVYFANKQGPAGEPGIYAVGVTGKNQRLLRQEPGAVPIGYSGDNALMIMRKVDKNFQVVKLGATAHLDQVILNNAAPAALSLCTQLDAANAGTICEKNITVAPYGHALLVQGLFKDGTTRLWSDNLVTGEQYLYREGSIGTPAILLGWDRRQVK